jgi:type IV secretion system protein VirB9
MKATVAFGLAVAAVLGLAPAACASAPVAEAPNIGVPATLAPAPELPVVVVERPTALPLPGQLMPVGGAYRAVERADPAARVAEANAAARIEPARDGFLNAVQVFPYTAGALYQVYAAPGHVTDIALEPGERLVGQGPVAAGDTARWIIGDTESGAGAARQVHILVKPTRPDLTTNLVINTDRRTYHLELRATPAAYMASVSWTYPQDAIFALRRHSAEAASAQPIAEGVPLHDLDFRYRIEGDRPAWRPMRAFDDGRQVFIVFPPDIDRGEMPPLFILGEDGAGELVNYRIDRNHMIVDRLFEAAELRLGDRPRVVRILRTDSRAAWRPSRGN